MDFESLVPVSQDLQFYILEWPLDHTEDGKTEAVSMVIMKRGGGFLLCLPLEFLPPEVVQEGNSGNAGAVGPSHEVRVGAVVLDGGQESPVGEELAVLVVDMDVSVASSMRPMADVEDIAVRFMPDDPHAYPQPGELVAKTFEWLQSMEPQMSAEWYPLEVSAESGREEPKRTPRPKQQAAFPGGATPTGGGSKAKKPTAASLAVSMQQVLDALPALSNQIQMISDRQSEMEEKLGRNPSVAALSKPLALNLPTGSQSQVASMARELRSPPRTTMRSSTSTPIRDLVPVHVEELQKDKEFTSEPKDVTQAILAQSAALTALVAQLSAGSNARVSRSIGWNKRSSRKGSSSVGVGTTSWHVLPVDGPQHGKTYVPNLESRDPSWSTTCQWNIRYEVPRKIRRVWKAKRVGLDSIPTHDHGGLRYVGELGSCKGHVGPPGGDDRTGLPRPRQVRLSSAFDSSRGSAIRSLHKPSTFAGEPCKGFLTSSGSAMGHGGISVLEGARYNLDKEERVVASFSSWRRTAFPTFAEEPWSTRRKRKRQRPWKEAAAGSRGFGAGLSSGPAGALDLIEEEVSFNSWAMALPRLVLKCRTEFSGQLARSFSVKRSGVPAAHTAVFPLPVPFDAFRRVAPSLAKGG